GITQTGSGLHDKRVDLAYDEMSHLASIQRFSDLAGTQLVTGSAYSYDSLNRLSSLRHVSASATVAFYDVTYDAANHITSITEGDGTAMYGYDDRYQLTSVDHSSPAK